MLLKKKIQIEEADTKFKIQIEEADRLMDDHMDYMIAMINNKS